MVPRTILEAPPLFGLTLRSTQKSVWATSPNSIRSFFLSLGAVCPSYPNERVFLSLLDTRNEAIVVYAQKEDGNVARRVVWGPTIYMPSISEWTHRFSWGGSDDDSSSNGQKKPQMQPMQQMQQMQAQQAYMPPATSKGQFSRLRTTPDTMEVDVELVRTADDGLLDVQLMITFQLVDVEKMLDTSEDPIRDLTNAVASDVVLVISKTRFNDFKGNTEVRAFHCMLSRVINVPSIFGL
jgi:hypothetical protein